MSRLAVSLSPVIGRDHSWKLTDDAGNRVAEGFVAIDLNGWWDEQADRSLPANWERLGAWDISGDQAVAPVRRSVRAVAKRVNTELPQVRAGLRQDTTDALVALFEKMRPDVAARYDAGAKTLIAKRWISQLTGVVEDRHMVTAEAIGSHVADQLDYPDFDAEVMRAYLALNAGFVAEGVVANAESSIRAAAEAQKDDENPDPVGHVFGILATSGAAALALQMVTSTANFAARDTAVKAGATGKVWRTTSSKPRKTHARMNGETVALDEKFSNGLMWPGDPEGDANEVAECRCSLTIIT